MQEQRDKQRVGHEHREKTDKRRAEKVTQRRRARGNKSLPQGGAGVLENMWEGGIGVSNSTKVMKKRKE